MRSDRMRFVVLTSLVLVGGLVVIAAQASRPEATMRTAAKALVAALADEQRAKLQIPFDAGEQSSSLFYHLYAGFELGTPALQPFVQISGLRWLESGDGSLPIRLKSGGTLDLDAVQNALGTGAFEGADVVNLGSPQVDNLDLITAALGFHVPLGEHVTLSVAYERPITEPKGIFQQRITSALVLEF